MTSPADLRLLHHGNDPVAAGFDWFDVAVAGAVVVLLVIFGVALYRFMQRRHGD